MARLSTAEDIINKTAVSVGLNSTADPVGSNEDTYIQLRQLLDDAGQEMVEIFPTQTLVQSYQVTTSSTDSGEYMLPDDYSYMIDQTGWEHTNRVSLGGPLSPQDWTYLKGRDLVSQSIYASFRLQDNLFTILPNDPVPEALDINFEYISRNWVREAGGIRRDTIGANTDTVLFEPILIRKFLKCKWLDSKGFDASSAKHEFDTLLNSRMGKDTGAPILSASQNQRGFPYLSTLGNTPDSGYGG